MIFADWHGFRVEINEWLTTSIFSYLSEKINVT